MSKAGSITEVLKSRRGWLQEQWLDDLRKSGVAREDLISARELKEQAGELIDLSGPAFERGGIEAWDEPAWEEVRSFLRRLSVQRAQQSVPPTDTAHFILALKRRLLEALKEQNQKDPAAHAAQADIVDEVFDQMGLFTMEIHQKTREEIIVRQQQELLELSTPVVKLWDGILALPLIGTLDSRRTQVVMEALLQEIVASGAEIAILDITGVPTVDTLVAQHLMKTVAAARLMGAECIISGIRPQIAQTVVHLGVDLKDIVTKATLADAFAEALSRTGAEIRSRKE